MSSADVIETSQVSETRRSDVNTVRSLGTIADNVDTHLTLGGLNGRVGITRRDSVALGVEKEMVDQSLHVLLHGRARGRRDLVVLHANRTSGHLVQTLVDDAERLAELLHTAQISVVAVTVNTNRDIELDLVIRVIGSTLADVPRDTRSSEHNTREGEVQGISSRDGSDILQSLDPDTVVCKHLLGLVDSVTKLGRPLVDVVEQTNGDILMHTTGANICGVETRTRHTLVEFLQTTMLAPSQPPLQFTTPKTHHQLLSLLEPPQERRKRTNIHSVRQNRHKMVQDTRQLAKQRPNPLCPLRNLNIEQLLHSQRKTLFIGHHRDVIQPIKVRQRLQIRPVLAQLLRATMQQTNVGIRANNLLAVELENQPQHAVGGRMLGAKVDCVMAHLARGDVVRLGGFGALRGLFLDGRLVVGIEGGREVLAYGEDAGALVGGLGGGISADGRCGEGTGCYGDGGELLGWSLYAEALGAVAGEPI